MRRILPVSAFICLLMLALPAGSGRAYAEDASVVRATRVDGTVLKNGAPLKEGDVIGRGDKIETKANSAAVLTWSNGSMVEIYPDTSMTLKGVVLERDRKLEKSLMDLNNGRVFIKAQVPDNLFCQLEVNAGGVMDTTQGAEFAIKYDSTVKKTTIWSLLGTVIVDMDTQQMRIDDGRQADIIAGEKLENPVPMPEKMKEALAAISKKLGGSLLVEDETWTPGPLRIKVGGVRNRRGQSPYTVKFKALVNGGSSKIKSVTWDFGDGENASGKDVQHTFTQGIYVVVVQVEDENGQKATAQINISVEQNCNC
ncbi:MAG: PKD domain-containing protein [Nitrospiraceae bacterium]|nr:PKD domain-containing protein [Nitrospiraceae bacterium]